MSVQIYEIAMTAGRVLFDPVLVVISLLSALIVLTGAAGRAAGVAEEILNRRGDASSDIAVK